MRKRINGLILMAAFSAVPLFSADPHLTSDERAKALEWLHNSRKEFLAALDGVTEAQWKWKPEPGRWSVGETAEHIVLAEAGLFETVQKALSAPADQEWEQKTQSKTRILEEYLAPRQGKAQAPESLVPGGRLTIAEVRERFVKQRESIEKFAQDTDAPLKEHTINNPFFGPLNGYQWLIYGPMHTMRHDKQIAEVKATAGYPK